MAIFQKVGDRSREGSALNNLATALGLAGKQDEAITASREALAIFRETGDRHTEGTALTNLGIALQEKGELHEAVTLLQQAVAIFQETEDQHREGIAFKQLETVRAAEDSDQGDSYFDLKNPASGP